MIFAAAAFVSERPHNYGSTASVAHIHSLYSVNIAGSPFQVMADKVDVVVRVTAAAVGFNVGFVNYIKAVNVTQNKELSIGG